MRIRTFASFSVAVLAMLVLATGCQEPTTTAGNSGDAHAGHDHDHDGHDHAGHDDEHDHPPHGPNHGHIFNFDDEGLTGEWCKYPDNDVIRVYLLGGDAKSAKPLVVEKFLIKPTVGNDATPFELEAENVDADGAAASFMLDDKLLQTAIPTGVMIEVVTKEKTYTGEIKAHQPLDH